MYRRKISALVLLLAIVCMPAKADSDADRALLKAAVRSSLAKIKEALAAGADINARKNHGVTSLMWVAFEGYSDVVRFLIEKGADVNAKDDSKRTVLMYAKKNQHRDVVKLLEQAGAR